MEKRPEGYRRLNGPKDPFNKEGAIIPGCPWTERQFQVMALAAQNKGPAKIAAIIKMKVGTVRSHLTNARLAAIPDEEDPLSLRELLKSPLAQDWLKRYLEGKNGQDI